MLVTIRDPSVLQQCEQSEIDEPSLRKILEDRTIYCSRSIPRPAKMGDLLLTDFGEAWIGKQHYRGQMQAEPYRSPEIILHLDWDCKVSVQKSIATPSLSLLLLTVVRSISGMQL